MRGERDLPLGHPSSSDFVPDSDDAKRYAQETADTSTQRDFPKGHPGAADNPDRVEPTNPLETSRDHSKPETIKAPAREENEAQEK